MAIVEDVFKNGFGAPLALALGIAVVGPIAGPVLGAVVRPVLKTAIKGGALAWGYGYWAAAGAAGYVQDTYREARAEVEGPTAQRRHVASSKVDEESKDGDLGSMTNDALRKLAQERGIELPQGYVRNDDLIGMLRSHDS
jgi:hypothetical protein